MFINRNLTTLESYLSISFEQFHASSLEDQTPFYAGGLERDFGVDSETLVGDLREWVGTERLGVFLEVIDRGGEIVLFEFV